MNFVFNDFKRRFLNGEVPSADTWTYIPVSTAFKNFFEINNGSDEYKLEQYRTLFDFKDVSDNYYRNKKYNYLYFDFSGATTATDGKGKLKYVDITDPGFSMKGYSLLNGRKVTHIWQKVVDDESFNVKPMFINNENFADFNMYYLKSIEGNPFIETYLQSGFYFIRSLEELEWFAERSKENSTIIGVIGDNIDGYIDKPIGPDEKTPFNGILDGNYFTLDIVIQAKNSDNGLVGVLGPQGIVRNIKLKHSDINLNRNSIECNIPINLKYIKKDGRDINCGMIVGRNYGRVENIDASELYTFNLYGFVPTVYSVTNKSDNYDWNEETKIVRSKFDYKNENYYFSNSFCINSPGNICPYVGYFAEGKFADDVAAACLDTNAPNFKDDQNYIEERSGYFENLYKPDYEWSTIDISGNEDGIIYNPLGLYLYTTNKATPESQIVSSFQFISGATDANAEYYIHSPLYYGLDSKGLWTTRNFGPSAAGGDKVYENKTVICYNSNLVKNAFGLDATTAATTSPSYEMTRCSMRMHPQARVAYNVGVIIGANYGSAFNIDVSAVVKNTSNFVGFIGGLAGKQAEGWVQSVNISIDNQFNYDLGENPASGGVVYYKQTPILPSSTYNALYHMTNEEEKLKITKNYYSAWYDNGFTDDDSPVNTAQNITNDVITYKLKPIFVVGGLFGRYVPTYNVNYSDSFIITGCFVNGVNLIYNDNYVDDATVVKSKENAFGAMIGKVDYSTTTYTTVFTPSLTCVNSQFHCEKYTGEPFIVYPKDAKGNPIPQLIEGTKSSCSSIAIGQKFVGIYELKNNILDSVAYNATNNDSVEILIKHKLKDYGIFDFCDYPINMSEHEGGIIQTHNFTDFMYPAATAIGDNGSPYYSLQFTADAGSYLAPTVYQNYDHWHQYFNFPNAVKPDTLGIEGDPAGWNKRNMAAQLINIEFSSCYSNISNYIQVYDDYLNNWNDDKIPPSTGNLPYNTFTSTADFYAIGKWWSYVRTSTNGGFADMPTETHQMINWDDSIDYSSYSGWFCQGLNPLNINYYLMNGTQNTFDGYTTVDFNVNSDVQYWYTKTTDMDDCFVKLNNGDCHYEDDDTLISPDTFKYTEVNCLQYLYNDDTKEQDLFYTSNRIYKKNILNYMGFYLATNYISSFELDKINKWENIDRSIKDSYFYYSYDNDLGLMNTIHENYVPLVSAFAFTQNVMYDAHDNYMGYFSSANNVTYDKENKTYDEYGNETRFKLDRIEVGEYYTPVQIREKLNNYVGTGIPTFTTTSVSSSDDFGGLLVVDSSGRNVMFYDNEKSTELTGNTVYFPCHTYVEKNMKLLLEID